MDYLGLLRQLLDYLGLGAAQEERRYGPAQLRLHSLVLVPLDGEDIAVGEVLEGAEEAGVDKLEEVPEFGKIVLNGRACEEYAGLGLQVHGGGGHLGVAVLDGVRLIKDHEVPLLLPQQFGLADEESVGAQHHAMVRSRRNGGGTVFLLVEEGHIEGGREALEFRLPVVQHRGRTQHQRRPAVGAVEHEGDGLDGLAKTHIVGKTGAGAPVGEARHPAEALLLIVAQLRLELRGDGHLQLGSLLHLFLELGKASVGLERGVVLVKHLGNGPHLIAGDMGALAVVLGQLGEGLELLGQLLAQDGILALAKPHIAAADKPLGHELEELRR